MATHAEIVRESASARHQRARRRRFIYAFVMIVACAGFFTLGFFVRGNQALLTRLGITSQTSEEDTNPGMTVNGSTYQSISARVAEIEGILNTYSINEYDLESLTSTIGESMAHATGDPSVKYISESRYQAYLKESSVQNVAGIGVLFSETAGVTSVADVFEGSSASVAGVAAGDIVVSIDGERSDAWTASEVIKAIARDEGDTVVITWRRPAESDSASEEYTTTLACHASSTENVTTELSDTVGYISIKQITQNASDLVREALTNLAAEGATCYVLDLSNCPGGYLTQAVEIADQFITSGVIVQIKTVSGTTKKNSTGTVTTDAPMAVIVNGSTSGAAEVLACALQESGRAKVVGSSTAGKGTVQVLRALSFGGAFRYTAAAYLTPLGREIEGRGVSLDVTISDEDLLYTIAEEMALAG